MSLRNRVPELLAPAFPEATPASAPTVVTVPMPENAWAPWLNVPSRSDGSFAGKVQEFADFCRYRAWKAMVGMAEAEEAQKWEAYAYHKGEWEGYDHARHVLDLLLDVEQGRVDPDRPWKKIAP